MMPVDSIQYQQNELSVRNDAMRRVDEKSQRVDKAVEGSVLQGKEGNESVTRRYNQRGRINRFDALRGQTIDTKA